MQRYNGSLVRQFPSLVTGNAAAGVEVTVKTLPALATATLYETNNTGGATLPNPIITDSVGFYSFYATDGIYQLEFSNSFPTVQVQIFDLSTLNAAKRELLIEQNASNAISVTGADHSKMFICTNAVDAEVVVTVGEAAIDVGGTPVDVAGTSIIFKQNTTVPVTFTTISGVTVNAAGGLSTAVQYSSVMLIAEDRYTWTLVGDIDTNSGPTVG